MVRELFKAEPDPWQQEALEAFPASPRLAMKSCKGPGKQLAKTIIISTPYGDRKWGDLAKGDLVFAEDGSPTRIVETYEQGVQPIFRVTFDDGSSTLAGAEHLWKVQGRVERRKGLGWAVLSTKEIVDRGVTVPNGRWKQKQFIIPQQGAAQFPHSEQSLDAYLVGVWIGDGSKGRPTYCKPNREVEQEINRRGYATHRGPDGKSVRVNGALREFELLDCYECGSYERFIPDNYKRASIQQRQDLLCGLMDTDGCIGDDGHMEYASTSEQLANDVVWLVRSLGGVAFIKEAIKEGWYRGEDGARIECRDCWRVTVVTSFNPFLIPHKAERWKDPRRSPSTERYLTRFIASIEPEGEADCMCIEVEHPSHCYLANDFIVTHNTCVLAWIAWNFLLTRPNPMCAATSISGDNLKSNFWTEMARWRNRTPLLQQKFEWTKTEIFSREQRDTWKMEARTWSKDADAEQIGKTLAGIHADYVLFILDESGGYPDAIMPTAEAIFAGNPVEAHIVQAGNPTDLKGPLYRACTSARHLWKVIEITADPDDPKRTTRVSADYAREQIAQYGKDNPWVLVNIFGRFPPSSLNSLIGPDEVEAAMKRYYREFEIGNAPRVLGVDVARFGDDASSICKRQGIQCFPFKKYRNLDSTQGAGIVSRLWDDWGADACFLDATGGFGAGWQDNLVLIGKAAVPVQFAGKAHEPSRYANKRAEMAWDAVDWIKRGGALPNCPELLAALTTTTYSVPKGILLLEPKEDIKARLGYSPDEFDSFILTFAEPVTGREGQRRRASRSAVTEYNPYAEMDNSLPKDYDRW